MAIRFAFTSASLGITNDALRKQPEGSVIEDKLR